MFFRELVHIPLELENSNEEKCAPDHAVNELVTVCCGESEGHGQARKLRVKLLEQAPDLVSKRTDTHIDRCHLAEALSDAIYLLITELEQLSKKVILSV